MGGSKYNIQVALDDKYSKSLAVVSAKQKQFKKELSATRAEAKKFSQSEKDLKAFTNVKSDMDATRLAIKKTRDELKATGKQVSENGGVMSASLKRQSIAQSKSLKVLTHRYDLQQKRMKALKKTLVSTAGNVGDLSKSQRLLAAKTLVANRKLAEQARRIEKVKRVENYLEARRQRNFQKEKQRLFQLNKLEKALQDARGKRNDKMISVAAAGSFLYAGSRVVKQAADFETSMVDVSKKASFKSNSGAVLSDKQQDKKLAQLQKWIVTAAPDLGLNPTELAQIVASGAGANVARAGREQRDLEEFSKLAAKMSVAFDDLTAKEAGKSVATWMASMKLDMAQSAELASAINHLSDNSAASTTAVTDLMTRTGSIMMSAGLDFKQSAALGAAILSANGNRSEMGATAAKNMALTLTQGDALSGSQKGTLGKLGLDPVQLSKDMQRDAVGAIYSLIEKIEKKPKYQRNSIISTLFGKESIGAISPLINNVKELERVMKASGNAVALRTSLDKEFSKQQATTNFKTKQMRDSFAAFAMVFGKELLPMISAGAEVLSRAADAGTEFINENEEVARVVIRAATAIAILKAGMIAWRVAGAAMEVVTLKRRVSEAKLGSTTTKTAANATRASIALDRLNASLGRTALGGFAGGGKGKSGKGKLGKLKRLGSKVPIVGTALAAGLGAYALSDVVSSDSATKGKDTGSIIGSIGGSMGGAAAGAALGSFVPIIGTAIGGIIGAIAGEELFSFIGGEVGGLFDNDTNKNGVTNNAQVVKVAEVINKSFDGHNALERSTVTKNSAPTIQFSPNIIIHGDANKQDVEQVVNESESRFKSFVSENLSDKLDVSMSDSIPSY